MYYNEIMLIVRYYYGLYYFCLLNRPKDLFDGHTKDILGTLNKMDLVGVFSEIVLHSRNKRTIYHN